MPALQLEVRVCGGSPEVHRRRLLTGWCSLVLHGVASAATLALPLLVTSALPTPASTIRTFLAEPRLVPPPPPPPPPAGRPAAPRTAPRVEADAPAAFTAPIEIPAGLKPDEGLDLGVDGGLAGGVAGGVPGGVVGAIVGGLPESLGPPPPVVPVRVSGLVKEPEKLTHVNPVYPPIAEAAGLEGVVVVEALIDIRGQVAEVRFLEGDHVFKDAALDAVRQWAYTPTLLDGVPVRVIMTVRVNFRLASSRRR